MKIPTLRNVAETGPYTHNGYFATLHDVVTFLNTRDVPGAWPEPEVAVNMTTKVGDLNLTSGEVDALVAFLKTLTDSSLSTVAGGRDAGGTVPSGLSRRWGGRFLRAGARASQYFAPTLHKRRVCMVLTCPV